MRIINAIKAYTAALDLLSSSRFGRLLPFCAVLWRCWDIAFAYERRVDLVSLEEMRLEAFKTHPSSRRSPRSCFPFYGHEKSKRSVAIVHSAVHSASERRRPTLSSVFGGRPP